MKFVKYFIKGLHYVVHTQKNFFWGDFFGKFTRFWVKIAVFYPNKNPAGFVGFHSRVWVGSGLILKVGFGFGSH